MNRDKIIQLAVSIIMIATMLFGRSVSYPDNIHNLHGLPLAWGSHQLVTIQGPVDYWHVNLVNLGIDLVFWISIVLVAPQVWDKFTQ
jgi:hypothetical protein